MVVNNTYFTVDLLTILTELKSQLVANDINLLYKIMDSGDDVMVCCPFHKNGQERRPSMGIRKSDGLCHCLACHTTTDLPSFISYCFGYYDDFGRFGWSWLVKNYLYVGVESRHPIELNLARSEKPSTKDIKYVSEEELDTYRVYHPYMYQRKLTNDVIDIFDIGYDDNTKCLTFPVRDITGGTLFVARRSVNTKYFNYPSGAEKPIYGLFELYRVARKDFNCIDTHIIYDFPKEVIICESMLDALVFWTIGKYAVALNGTGTTLQFKQLNELPCRKFILATDMDDAGQKARQRLRNSIKGSKMITEYAFPQGRKDANDCTREELLALQEIL